jgi:NAD(P)H-dependent flavin oxidoreductase YrpB (nitropropane dioxygenase family)
MSKESGLTSPLRRKMLDGLRDGTLEVRTDGAASPTGFPFKVALIDGTISETETYEKRPRLCDLGYLRQPYAREGGAIGFRCPAEPIEIFVRKGGTADGAAGSKCLCNALMTNIGLGQERKDGYVEDPIITLGSDLAGARRLDSEHWLHGGSSDGWAAKEAVNWLLSEVSSGTTPAPLNEPVPATS